MFFKPSWSILNITFKTGSFLKHILKESKNKDDDKLENIFNIFLNYSQLDLKLPYLRSFEKINLLKINDLSAIERQLSLP